VRAADHVAVQLAPEDLGVPALQPGRSGHAGVGKQLVPVQAEDLQPPAEPTPLRARLQPAAASEATAPPTAPVRKIVRLGREARARPAGPAEALSAVTHRM
jgi:hypothetical protein